MEHISQGQRAIPIHILPQRHSDTALRTPSSSPQTTTQDIPPAFLRTLAYLFELVKKGLEYAPLTEEDVEAGAPPLTWAPPLWPTEPAVQPVSLEDPMQLFQAAPYWCYLYNHEPQRSKKTPPKTAAQMASMYMCVRAVCPPASALCQQRCVCMHCIHVQALSYAGMPCLSGLCVS